MLVARMIDTLTQSTRSYLALLSRSNTGTLRHPVCRITPLPDTFKSIENAAWPVITCSLPAGLKFHPDSGATLVPTTHPGRAIPIHILSYNSASGVARLAAHSIPADTTGHLIIDFKWLLERLIQWLEKHGASIANPFQLAGHHPQIHETVGNETISAEQLESVTSLLANPVAYVWGPPGTGKTRHVLAESVAHLVRSGKTVLVTAPTNLAVDNALDAILRTEGTRRLDILRIGLPSDDFRNQWPECCEDRALNESLSRLNQKLDWLTERLNASRLKAPLTERSSSLSAAIDTSRTEVELSEHELSHLDAEHARVAAELDQLQLQIESSQQHLDQSTLALAALDIPGRESEIDILEREQTSLIGELHDSESRIAAMPLWRALLTPRKTRLIQHRDRIARRLDSVEATLHRKRTTFATISSEAQALADASADLNLLRTSQDQHHSSHLSRLSDINNARTTAANNLTSKTAFIDASTLELSGITEQLQQLDSIDSLPADEQQIAEATAECERLRASMAAITQNLSDKRVLGMTLDGFIGLTMNQSLFIDHVIVDEAGYAPLAKVIPLCSLRCPISLLGDHRQLPPVYVSKNHIESECFWGTSALYLEDAFTLPIDTPFEALFQRSKSEPRFENIHRTQLTRSYRFGPRLAALLDRHFYNIGLCSNSSAQTSVVIVHCPPVPTRRRMRRQNPAECAAIIERIRSWLDCKNETKGTLAVISPYVNQVKLLQSAIRREFAATDNIDAIDVLTVHKAQGREWDTVFFSASDTGRLQGNSPWLSDTSSTLAPGALVVNTAISRARKHLRIFCDQDFWAQRRSPDSLLTALSIRG